MTGASALYYPAEISVLLLNYLLHSTFFVVAVGVLSIALRPARPHIRVLLWKAALVVPLLTASAAPLFGLPHFGVEVVIADSATAPRGMQGMVLDSVGDDEREQRYRAALPIAEFAEDNRGDRIRVTTGAETVAFAGPTHWPWRADSPVWVALLASWYTGAVLGLMLLVRQALWLAWLRQQSVPVTDAVLRTAARRLTKRAAAGRPVAMLESNRCRGPLSAGVWRPFILIPSLFLRMLSGREKEALLAHELVHIGRRDALWNVVAQLICRIFFFQPCNHFARRRLQIEMEFVADWEAAEMLEERAGLASCLARLGELLTAAAPARPCGLAAGMAEFRSTLGRRVESLLAEPRESSTAARHLGTGAAASLLVSVAIASVVLAPRAIAHTPPNTNPETRKQQMIRPVTALAVLASLTAPAAADGNQQSTQEQAAPRSNAAPAQPGTFPEGLRDFAGMLVGRLVQKDVENGTFTVDVDAVASVWRISKAEKPKIAVGRQFTVNGVAGKWLDVLLLAKEGETLQFGARHNGGDQLTFPGEMLRKVAPYQAEDYPVLPEGFRGFQGALGATIVKKDPTTLELMIRADRLLDTWKNSIAKEPHSIQGKQLIVNGFWQRRDAFHGLKVGDAIEVGLRHAAYHSDRLGVHEFVRPAKAASIAKNGLPDGMGGFSGMLVGRLTAKDVERGTFAVEVDAVPRIWRNNKADRPKSIVGKTIEVDGVTGKWLDVLLVVKQGETLEFEAQHQGGGRLTFPGEWMRKTAAVQPGDYPELPEAFRGFRGSVVGKVAKLDHELAELSLQVTDIKQAGPESTARDARSIVGKPLTVLGFWNQREAFDALREGDTIECSLRHIQLRSDHVNANEFRKIQ